MRRLAGAAALLLCTAPAPAAAQVEGRWAMVLGGGATGSLRGELRIGDERGRAGGTIWLQNSDNPVPLGDVEREGDRISFVVPADGRLRFVGALEGGSLRGTATGDSGAARPWTAAPLSQHTEYYPVLPRFRLREVVAGRRGAELRLPGPWVAAARVAGVGTDSEYTRLAAASGVQRLRGDTLVSVSPLRAMGLARRAEMTAAARVALEAIRKQIPDPATAAAFDRIFRPRGAWLLDIHDAALALARVGSPGLQLADAAPALAAAGWLPAGPPADREAISHALHRLRLLSATDSVEARAVREQARRGADRSAVALELLLGGYEAAEAWHVGALRFLLTARWIGGPGPARSLDDLVRASWRGIADSLDTPEIGSRLFGYPQAVPRYGVPTSLFARLVAAENWSARQWLGRHGEAELLESLRYMTLDFGEAAAAESGSEIFRLTSVKRQSLESTNGFLEPRDAILVDPGYIPLFALGAVIHEWQHLIVERVRRNALRPDGEVVVLPSIDPFVAEGIAEWRTERLLDPLAARIPLLGLGEAEKRARLALAGDTEQHVLGYNMVRAFAAVPLPDERRMQLLFGAAADPRTLPAAPEMRRAWARFGGPELVVPAPSRRVLIPETTFTIEDGYPDVVSTRIILHSLP